MSLRGAAYIAGAFEHPSRKIVDLSIAELHAEVAKGALDDAGLSLGDVDGYFCAGDAPGLGPLSMVDYLGLNVRHVDTTNTGGSAYIVAVGHAMQAIATGRCEVALITMAGMPRAGRFVAGEIAYMTDPASPDVLAELPFGPDTVGLYALSARRHMHDWGTTSEQLAWVKVSASRHAQHNPHAMLRTPVTVEEVLASTMIADPLHKLDCCVTSDGGGALVVTRPEIARTLKRPCVRVLGAAEAVKHMNGGWADITSSAAALTGPRAFEEANVKPSDIKYASLYDSFTITVLIQLEDLGLCPRGSAGRFVAEGGIIAGEGPLPVNTDGGGLCNNHPAFRGGMPKIVEAVRQLRGEAAPQVQVANCDLALVHGTGGYLSTRHCGATLILERA